LRNSNGLDRTRRNRDQATLSRHEFGQQRVAEADGGRRRTDPGRLDEGADLDGLLALHQRDDRALGAGSRSASGAVDIGLELGRRVGVDDQLNVVDVDPASGDVGRDQGARGAGVEGGEIAGASVLSEVAVQLDRRHPQRVEFASQGLGAVLGAREDDRTT